MATQPRSPADHYRAAETALAALPVDEPTTLAVTALVSAILATVPAKALRGQHRRMRGATLRQDDRSPSDRWLFGDNDQGAQ